LSTHHFRAHRPSNFFVNSDLNNLILESDENNNFINQTLYVGAWQEFYGNVSAVKILSDFLLKNVSSWGNEINLNGNVFMTDKESEIDWLSLLAIGRNITGGNSIDDFSEIDDILGMQDFEDSILTQEDIEAIKLADKEYKERKLVSLEDIEKLRKKNVSN